MNIPVNPPVITQVSRAIFDIWSTESIKEISVKKITEPKSFEKAGALNQDGLYSNALGAIKKFEVCTTCGQTDLTCPGHYGHIELAAPVYHPMLVQTMYQILSKCCLNCFHLRLSQPLLKLFLAQLDALNCGFDHLIEELDDIARDLCQPDIMASSNKKKANSEDPYIHIMLGNKLVARIEEEKEKTPNFQYQKRPQQRSIVERLSKLFRLFINGQLIKPSKICPNCGEKKENMSLHQQSVIVVGVNSSKPIDELDAMQEEQVIRAKAASKSKGGKKKSKSSFKCDKDFHYLKTDEKCFLTPIGARYFLRRLWKNEKRTMQRLFHFLNLEGQSAPNVGASQTKDDKDEEMDEQTGELDDKSKYDDHKSEPVDLFFIDTILVPPPKFRPPMSQRGYSFEGPRTAALSNVIKGSIIVKDFITKLSNEKDEVEAEKLQPKLQAHWKTLQTAVNCLYDNEMDKYGKNKYPGLKQLIDKKEGLFRKNMMGKRVNFAARSVISPDPNILVDQIGVPLVFAKRLTYPQPVTPWNIESLRQAVLNGPDKYPGAASVVYDDGPPFSLSLAKESVRQNAAARLSYNPRFNKQKGHSMDCTRATIVNRHLVTGDVLLFNRQPTLHKPSIMAFRARVLPNEKGFRLHYANCKSFNADFDGDEMNAHLPQSELARSEAYNIASVNYQYLVPKDGSPLGGLIQDHVVAVCILTQRDQFFDKERYNQLVYCAISFLAKPIKLEKPAILKPQHLWTGKQIITTVIKNCIPEGRPPPSLNIKSKIGPKILNIKPEFEKLSDCHVYIKDGELLAGFMDKSNVGATQYGLIHICYELYGGETSSALMSAFARLSTCYLQLYEGFTLGIADILVEDDANKDRQKYIKESLTVGNKSAMEALNATVELDEEELEEKLRDAHSDRDPLPMKKLDASMKKRTDKIASEISSRCLPEGLLVRFPDNNLQMMIQSGAKGGTVNALQISCLLGQIELEGRRVPLSMSGRSLPSFKPYDTSPKAGGFVSGRFLTGIQPQEFFFHCMAGREGLIDTAVKTSRSGYLQRCLIKHLEGLTVHYDSTVRDSCGSVIQFLYGEDGLDIVKSQMLKQKAFPSLVENYKIVRPNQEEMNIINKSRETYEEDIINRTDEIQNWLEHHGVNRVQKVRGSGFLDFLASKMKEVQVELDDSGPIDVKSENIDLSLTSLDSKDVSSSTVNSTARVTNRSIGSHHHDEAFESWYKLSFKEKKKWNKFWSLCPDPLTSVMNPGSHFGVVPEAFDQLIENFVRNNPKLIVDSSQLIGASSLESHMACDANPELSRSIMSHLNLSKSNSEGPQLTKLEFYELCYNLYMKMLAQPGEAVGLLAAQSIGEPSTQMTLNTFHFAGRGEMNVTLGIPRLREILMTASAKIGTPSMDLPLLVSMKDEFGEELDEAAIEDQAKRVKLALNAVRLSDVLECVDITELLVDSHDHKKYTCGRSQEKSTGGRKRAKSSSSDIKPSGAQTIQYELTFHILPSRFYKHEFKTSSSRIMKFIEESFVAQLIDSMIKRQKRLRIGGSLFDVLSAKAKRREQTAQSGKSASGAVSAENDVEELQLDDYNAKEKAKEKAKDDESSSEDDDDGEGDNTAQRMRNRRNQDLDYEEPEDDDLEVGDLEAKTAQAEEDEREVIVDEENPANGREGDERQIIVTPGGKTMSTSEVNRVASQADDDDEADADTAAADESEDKKLAGQHTELAGFEDTKSAYATPANEPSLGQKDIEEPARKKKKLSLEEEQQVANKLTTKASRAKIDPEVAQQRQSQVKSIPNVYDYEFDLKHERWCKVTICLPLDVTRLDMSALIESEAKRTYVHRVGNIQRALIVKDVGAKSRGAKCDKMIKTEGVSLLSLVRFNHILDLNAIYSNDIHAIARTYGIEAASQAIRREMANVFAVYGIEVDQRHLSLIADYMTYNGSIRGMNRMSMEASASPFQQMSYESSLRYLKWAAILGLHDDIKSPSASLVFGKPTQGGTGLFGLLSDAAQVLDAPFDRRRDRHSAHGWTTSKPRQGPRDTDTSGGWTSNAKTTDSSSFKAETGDDWNKAADAATAPLETQPETQPASNPEPQAEAADNTEWW